MPLLVFTLLLLDCAEHTGRVEWVRSSFEGHSTNNQNLVFSAFFGEISILGSQEVITKIGSIAKIGLPIGPNRV
jgi:hypothetical protein